MQNPTAFWTYFNAFIGHNVFTSCLIWYATSSTPALYTLTCANISGLEIRMIHYPHVSQQSELSQLPLLLQHAPSPNQTACEEEQLLISAEIRWNLHLYLTCSHLPFLFFNQAFANQTALSEKGLAEVLPILTQHNVASADGTGCRVTFVLSELFDALILWNATCWTDKMFRDKARSQWVRNIINQTWLCVLTMHSFDSGH